MSHLSHHQAGKTKAKTPPCTSLEVSESNKKEFATLALHANVTSTASGCTFSMVVKLLTAAANFDVDDVCGLVAAGSTGPVYCARYIPWLLECISMLHMQRFSCFHALALHKSCLHHAPDIIIVPLRTLFVGCLTAASS